MFRVVALVPSPPLLVPELTGNGAAEASDVREATLRAGRRLGEASDRWLVLGVGDRTCRFDSTVSGTFAGYGVDVAVSLSPEAETVDPELPLPALIAAWLRGEVSPDVDAEVVLVGRDDTSVENRRIGTELRAEIDADPRRWGLLVVGDGANTLSAKAPGSFDHRAADIQNEIDDALATANLGALSALDRGLCRDVGVDGAAVWQALVGIVGEDRLDGSALYRDAPFGVGYFVGTWDVRA